MTVTAQQIRQVMNSSVGSETFFKRAYSNSMDYTEGVMELQRQCELYWLVDVVYSHMPAVLKDFAETDERFYIVTLKVNDNHEAIFTITREEYTEDSEAEIEVARQEIDYTDLPEVEIKLWLELAGYEPTLFRLLCPSEH